MEIVGNDNNQTKKIKILKETLREADSKIDDLEYKIQEEQKKNQNLTKINSKNMDIIKEKDIIIQNLEDTIIQEKNKINKLENDIKNSKTKPSRSLLEPLLENTTYNFSNEYEYKDNNKEELKIIKKKLEEIRKENLNYKQHLEKLEKDTSEYCLKIKMLEDLNNNYEQKIQKHTNNVVQNNKKYDISLEDEIYISASQNNLNILKTEIEKLNSVKNNLENNIYDLSSTLENKNSKKKICCFF